MEISWVQMNGMESDSTSRTRLLVLSFIEGGCVMMVELAGAKMLAPWFGTSLYVWSAVLGVTLGGLMLGYYAGGILSRRAAENEKVLYWIMLVAGVFMVCMPLLAHTMMKLTGEMSLQAGSVAALMVYMFPPLFCMGMVSPLIINLLTHLPGLAGNSAGKVYAISTLGGIIATFLMGFYVIPEFGISKPVIGGGIILAFYPIIGLWQKYRRVLPQALFLIVGLLGYYGWKETDVSGKGFKLLHHAEGMMGQLKIVDFKEEWEGRQIRAMVVNNTLQTIIDIRDPDFDYWAYTSTIASLADFFPANSRILLVGMGGGTMVRRLADKGYSIDAVEIDGRMRDLAIKYFSMPANVPVYVDDGRHYIRKSGINYDMIILDAFRGETAPEHLLTLESLRQIRSILNPGGMLVINFYGYVHGQSGQITRSVLHTVRAAGFYSRFLLTPGEDDDRNAIFVCSMEDQTLTALSPIIDQLPTSEINPENLSGGTLLTDEKPALRHYNTAALQWRKLYKAWFARMEQTWTRS